MRALVVVIDSFGIGALPDAPEYGDRGANTALHICERIPGEKWPVLKSMGLGNAGGLLAFSLPGCEAVPEPIASWGIMGQRSPGKDTTTGHWEIAGIVLKEPFGSFGPDYPSFPPELVERFERETGRGILGNRAASGTDIIRDLGAEHMATGKPICYTSADSVFQIAAHQDVIPLEEQYRICGIARRLVDPYRIARVIARPFTGEPGSFTRTAYRKDFSIELPSEGLLRRLARHGVRTIGVGKIGNIFDEQGLTEDFPDKGNPACLDRIESLIDRPRDGNEFIFVNLVDTDMVYGHRRDPQGYFRAVAEIDRRLGILLPRLGREDLLIVTADHGCDPTFPGTDHTREYVPLLSFRPGAERKNLGIRDTHADIAETICTFFGVPLMEAGTPFP